MKTLTEPSRRASDGLAFIRISAPRARTCRSRDPIKWHHSLSAWQPDPCLSHTFCRPVSRTIFRKKFLLRSRLVEKLQFTDEGLRTPLTRACHAPQTGTK